VKRILPIYAAGVYLFLHLPLLALAAFSFNDSPLSVWEGFSLRWYRQLAGNEALWDATWNSLLIAMASTALAASAGTLAAYGLWKRRDRWLEPALALSLVTPEIVLGISLLAFFQGLFRFLDARLGMHTVILAHTTFCLAYVVAVVLSRLRTMDASLEEAALDLGARPWTAFRSVTLPLLAPAVGAAALLAFSISFDDYVVTSLVAGVDSETLPMVIYAMARRGVSPVVNAISTLIIVAIGLLILLAERVRRSSGQSA
jgi:ABC-type spermidine/putrescine transport system permease subunit II